MKRYIATLVFALGILITACSANSDDMYTEYEMPSETYQVTPTATPTAAPIPITEETPAEQQEDCMMAFIGAAIDMLVVDTPTVFIEQPACMLDHEAVAFIESIIDMFAVGTLKGEIGRALDVVPFGVFPAYDGWCPPDASHYRYILLAAPGYINECEMDSMDFDAIYDGRLQVVAFVVYDGDNRLYSYTMYYMGETGIREIRDGHNHAITGPRDTRMNLHNVIGNRNSRRPFEHHRSNMHTPIGYSTIDGYTVYFFDVGVRMFIDKTDGAIARIFVDHRQAGTMWFGFNGIFGESNYDDVVAIFGNEPYIVISDDTAVAQLDAVKAYGYWERDRFVVFFFDSNGSVVITYCFDPYALPNYFLQS